ncbi:hypothetical protein CHARACLAT_009961 [Characodon lateralis]|uniref:Uncharacterized protein n=1 Tax=Characodon lateralis TaxID=208331 RepID=A0ABU7CQG7_9TELE|nr:hypothetical protein [Characodon lateralis]
MSVFVHHKAVITPPHPKLQLHTAPLRLDLCLLGPDQLVGFKHLNLFLGVRENVSGCFPSLPSFLIFDGLLCWKFVRREFIPTLQNKRFQLILGSPRLDLFGSNSHGGVKAQR